MTKDGFTKAYHGPFQKKEAEELVADLNKSPVIEKAKIRARSIIKNQYDVYIK